MQEATLHFEEVGVKFPSEKALTIFPITEPK